MDSRGLGIGTWQGIGGWNHRKSRAIAFLVKRDAGSIPVAQALRSPQKPRQEPLRWLQLYLYRLIAGPRYQPTSGLCILQHPDGGECAHLNIESGIVGSDADARDECPHEFLPVFKAPE